MPQLKRHQIILMMQAVLMLIYFASATKMSHRSISGSVAAEGRLCRVGPSTDMGALCISLHASDPCSKLLKSGRLNLHHSCSISVIAPLDALTDKAVTAQSVCGVQLESLPWPSQTVYFSFVSHACCWEKKSCFHTKKYIVFRSISHKILPDKSSAMPSLVRNIPICFFVLTNNMYPHAMHTSFPSSPISQVSLLKQLLDVWVLQTSEV